jgi:hypothetical protein
MLEVDVLTKNKDVFNPDPDLMNKKYGIWDLTNSSLTYKNVDVNVDTVFMVPEDIQMRPDLLAYRKYGKEGYFGSMLKFNGISNPFSLTEGFFMYMPSESSIQRAFDEKKKLDKGGNTNASPAQAFRKSQESKIVKPSEGRSKFLESKIKNQPGQVLPPNLRQEGERSTTRKNGFIIFGPDTGGSLQSQSSSK